MSPHFAAGAASFLATESTSTVLIPRLMTRIAGHEKCWASLVFSLSIFLFLFFAEPCFHKIFLFGMWRISVRTRSCRSDLLWRQLSSVLAVLHKFHLHYSSWLLGKTTSPNHGSRNCWFGMKPILWVSIRAPRPAEWGAILFLCRPGLMQPGLDQGISQTVKCQARTRVLTFTSEILTLSFLGLVLTQFFFKCWMLHRDPSMYTAYGPRGLYWNPR